MKYRQLGTTDLRVSELCLGVAFRGHQGKSRTEEDCVATIERALELGINFFDSANSYGQGWSEELLGRTVKRLGRRDDLVITTKVGSPVGEAPNDRGLSREHITREIERSLRRLQMDHVEVYLLHEPDPNTPLEETLRVMEEVVRQGKARYIGVSNHPAAEIVELLWLADRGDLTSPAVLQYQYSLLHRWETETEFAPLCERYGLGLMAYSPLAIGLLTGQVRPGKPVPPESYWYEKTGAESVLETAEPIVATLIEVAREVGKTPVQVALAWLLANPELSAPILGSELPEHIDEAVGAVGWQPPAEAKAMLDGVSAGGGPFELTGSSRRRRARRRRTSHGG